MNCKQCGNERTACPCPNCGDQYHEGARMPADEYAAIAFGMSAPGTVTGSFDLRPLVGHCSYCNAESQPPYASLF